MRLTPLTLPSLAMMAGLLFSGCSRMDDGPSAGITTIGNTIAGTVVDDKGTLVANAEVRLLKPDYNPANDVSETGYEVVRTDADGRYLFKEVEPGTYNLELAKEDQAAIIPGFRITKERPDDTAPKAELYKPGAITIVFGSAGVKLGGHFYMPGTTRHRRIDTTSMRLGSLTLPYVAAGHYASLRYQDPEDSTGTEVLEPRTLDLVPADTLIMIPNSAWEIVRKVTLNTSATGADVKGDNYDFPVLLRLNAPGFDFSRVRKDGADIRFIKADGSPLPFYISRYDSASGVAEAWVKMDTVYGSTRTQSFYLLAGNPDTASTLSDAKGVFPGSTGYMGLWNLDDAENLADAVAGNSAVNHGAESVDGIIGKAVRFRGAAWVDVPGKAFAGLGKKISISFWQKSGDTLQSQPGDIFGGLDTDGAVVLRMHDPFGDTLVYWDAGGSDRVEKKTDAEAKNRTGWNFWSLTKDADKGEMKIYLNGKVWQTATGKTAPIGNIQSFVLSFSGTDSYALDEFRLSRSTGSDDRVRLTYETQKPGGTAVVIGK